MLVLDFYQSTSCISYYIKLAIILNIKLLKWSTSFINIAKLKAKPSIILSLY